MSSTSNPSLLRALVVDDESGIRCLIATALAKEGFVCDVAASVAEAIEYITNDRYHLVITDLAMPNRNGHSFAVELLAMKERPIVVVLTGVLEPKIAKDLIARGVDDVVFKPVQIMMFAAKMRSLTDRHVQTKPQTNTAPEPASQSATSNSAKLVPLGRLPRVSQGDLDQQLEGMGRIPTISRAAIEVFKLTTNADSSCQQVAAAVQREPALIADVLRLANSSFFNPSVQKFTSVEQAVVRLGQKRVGELALTSAAFATVTQEKVPFFSLGRIWRKCLAAGICLEMLLEQSKTVPSPSGLFCAAVLQPMGRVLLASAFPEIYDGMLKQCESAHKSLSELEAYVFPMPPGEVAATTLAAWGIPDAIHRPLRHIDASFRSLSSLSDPMRSRVELIKTAVFVGELATAQFEPWDLIDIPQAPMLNRLGIQSIDITIRQCREDLKHLTSFTNESVSTNVKNNDVPTLEGLPVAYKRVHSESIDFIPHLLLATGRNIVSLADEIPDEEDVVINALGAAVHQVIRYLRRPRNHDTVLFSDAESASRMQDLGRLIVLPCAYRQIRESLELAPTNPVAATPAAVQMPSHVASNA